MSNVKARSESTIVVRGRTFTIEKIEWKDSDGLSFDISDTLTGQQLHNESYDDEPEAVDVEDLLDSLSDDPTHDGFFDGDEVDAIESILAATRQEAS